MILTWQEPTNLENSIAEFLDDQIAQSTLTLLDANGIPVVPIVRIGRTFNVNWSLPMIQLYFDDTPVIRDIELGSNLKEINYLIIFEIRCALPGQEINLGKWVENTLNNGFEYYDYSPNSVNPNSPSKTQVGRVSLKFITSRPVSVGDDVELFDKYRYRLSIQCWISS